MSARMVSIDRIVDETEKPAAFPISNGMRIVSWNICFRNSDWDDAWRFVRDSGADIICLQEVPERFLAKLKTLPYHCATGVDVDRLFPAGTERNFLVILSAYPVCATGSVSFDVPYLPLRTRLFVWLMRRRQWTKIGNRTALWADVETPSGMLRVFCLHLLLAYPAVRRTEFERVMVDHRASASIVCGDFNLLEYPKATILNWLLGGPFIEIFRWTRERRQMERRFTELKLQNPLRGKATHNYSSRQQLSHILVPEGARIVKAEVEPEYHGSDHRPVIVETE